MIVCLVNCNITFKGDVCVCVCARIGAHVNSCISARLFHLSPSVSVCVSLYSHVCQCVVSAHHKRHAVAGLMTTTKQKQKTTTLTVGNRYDSYHGFVVPASQLLISGHERHIHLMVLVWWILFYVCASFCLVRGLVVGPRITLPSMLESRRRHT